MDHPLGKVLASGNGKGNRAIYADWISTLLLVVLGVGLLCFISYDLQKNSEMQRCGERADELAWYAALAFWLGIVGTFVSVFGTALHVRGFARTEITVYEKGIAGIGCGRFYEFTYRTYRFQLTYDEIASISTLDWLFSLGIVIHAPNARYRCYCLNPSEIQMAIGTAKFGDGPTASVVEV